MFILLMMVVILFSCVLTGGMRRYALAKNVMDAPNHRSAHSVPTPRGGGVAFVITAWTATFLLPCFGFIPPPGSMVLMSSGVFVAALGFLDDHIHIRAIWRFIGHTIAAGFALYWMHGAPSLIFYSWVLPAGILANVLGVFYLIWFTNLYNFMDGIDGLAALEVVAVCFGMVGVYGLCGEYSLMILPLVLAASAMGFLYWNWPPARIFMGDAGSGFLGFMVAVLSLQAAHKCMPFFWSWLILLGVFVVDATLTLLRRAWCLEKVYEAHATHAYQHASRQMKSHRVVTIAVLLINVIWLWPLACLVGLQQLNGLIGVLLAYFPLILLAMLFRAGKKST